MDRISDIVKPWTECSPGLPALVDHEGSWSYAELNRIISETQAWLAGLGVRPGDRVMIVGENCRAFAAILLALAGMDAWPVLVNARLAAREVDEIRDHSGARRVIFTTAISPLAAKHATRLGAVVESVAHLGRLGIGPLNENAQAEPLDANCENRVAALIYTSGSTGHPKGVMLTHRNLLFAAAGSAKIRSLAPGDRIYGILPLSHVAGLSVALIGVLIGGAAVHLFRRFDPGETFRALRKDRLTVILGTPAMFALLVEYAGLKGIKPGDFPPPRIISASGAPLHADLKSAAEKLFGGPLHNAYGMTECSPNIAQTRIESPLSSTSAGPAFPGIELKLTGECRRRVADGEAGELWVRGPNVMKGYYRAPEETAAALDLEGWFRTGDLARLENGNLFIVGRSKEMIIRFGFNVYPAEVESVLNTHPAVARSAVIGRAPGGAHGDEEVIAFVQPQPHQKITAAEIAEHAARHLAPYKRPSSISVIPALPLNANGKVAKDQLANIAPG